MDIALPDTITAETIQRARQAADALATLAAAGALPDGITQDALEALQAIMASLAEAAIEDSSDLSPSEAAERLRVARPSVMRLIARGELSSRKDGGHYVLSPRELRAFQARLASVRREALSDLTAMADEFGF